MAKKQSDLEKELLAFFEAVPIAGKTHNGEVQLRQLASKLAAIGVGPAELIKPLAEELAKINTQ
jgi:hypothetical protein